MSNDDKCPCVDGLPDPCTLCGAPADGVCEIDTLVGWKHRAQRAEAEARQLREAIEFTASALDFEIDGDKFPRSVRQSLLDQLAVIDAAVAEGAEDPDAPTTD